MEALKCYAKNLSTNYENVKHWILNSGLIITKPDDKNYGAVHSFFEEETQKYGFLYPEITGYSISALCFLYEIEKNDTYLNLAKASSDWLIGIYEKYGSIIQGIEENSDHRRQLAYSFDTAVCTKGLLDCYKLTKEEKFLSNAEKLLEWLEAAIKDNGKVLPYKDLQTNTFTSSEEVWYKKWGCLHIKIAIPLLCLYQIKKEKKYLDTSNAICNTISNFQKKDGSITIHENTKTINLHTMCYALEGLLYAFSITKDETYLQSIEQALTWSSDQIKEDGSISLWFNSKHQSKAVYPVAQIIRLMILVDKHRNSNQFLQSVLKLRSFMSTLQAIDNNPKVNGGFYEEYSKRMFRWKKGKKLNSWGSLFALQGLYWFDNYEKISFKNSISQLF